MSSISLRSSLRLAGRQSGAALLAFMLVLVIAGASILVGRLNEHAETYVRDTRTQVSLGEAKRALLSYAMNYPELRAPTVKGPGFLPCPDRHAVTDPLFGNPSSNCALSSGTTLGRLPFRILGFEDLRDGSASYLWYSVSDNFKNVLSNDTIMNSETPGQLSLDGSGDIVAVIIAPGEPVASQAGRPSSNETDYLEDDNATATDGSFVTTSTGEFNDQVITITRDELMEAVERRISSEVRAILAEYRSDHGAYPWLVPFADPKAGGRWLTGEHSGSDDSGSLSDSSADFVEWGVANGDRLWNLTDGSVGVVTAVAATTLTIGAGMQLGTDNDFDSSTGAGGPDEYYVEVRGLPARLGGTATAGSAGLVLEDTARDFEELLVAPGDIVDNLDDGSSGMVESVDNDQITVTALSGGTNNVFSAFDDYRIRNNSGTATALSAALTLEDTGADFLTMGIQAGDLVHNLSDASFGRVATVSNATTLTLSELEFGTNNVFNPGDSYAITRFTGVSGNAEGLLPVHEPGAAFASAFAVDWSLTAANGNTVPPPATSGTSSTYDTGITNWIEDSSGHSGTVTIDVASGRCIWLTRDISDCLGTSVDADFLTGTADLTFDFGTIYIYDLAVDFPGAGVKPGDKVENVTGGVSGIVMQTWSSPNQNWFRSARIGGQPAFSAGSGDEFRVSVATAENPNIAGWANNLTNTACTFGADFSFVEIGVDVVKNGSAGNAVGMITAVSTPVVGWWCVTYTDLQGGSSSDINVGNTYTVYYDFVDQRRYEFNAEFPGTSAVTDTAGVRERDVCLGYGADCQTGPSNNPLPGDGATALVTIEDYDAGGNLVGSATATVPAAGSPQGSIRIAGISYYLSEDDDLPAWFLKNRWHQLIYAAYSTGYAPGGVGSCTAGMDCLDLAVQVPVAGSYNDRHALVLAAGAELASQDRTAGTLASYLENENASAGDDAFERSEMTALFNDQVSIVCPDGLNPLCP